MRAARLVAPRQWELIDVDKPEPGQDQMLVRLERSAVCGTDKPYYCGGSLFLVDRQYTFAESTVFGFGSGLGFFLAITSMAAIRHKLSYANVPKGLRGLGITMLLTGLLSMAFMAFSGIDL